MRNILYLFVIFILVKEKSQAKVISQNEKIFNIKKNTILDDKTKIVFNIDKIETVTDEKDLEIFLNKMTKKETIAKKIIENSSVKVIDSFTIEKDDSFNCINVLNDYKRSKPLINDFNQELNNLIEIRDLIERETNFGFD